MLLSANNEPGVTGTGQLSTAWKISTRQGLPRGSSGLWLH